MLDDPTVLVLAGFKNARALADEFELPELADMFESLSGSRPADDTDPAEVARDLLKLAKEVAK